MTLSERLYESLSQVRSQFPLLAEAMIPGTPRRWTQKDLSESARARRDEEDRIDRRNRAKNSARGLKPLGASAAPLRLDVLDVEINVETSVGELEDAVCDRLGLTPLLAETTVARVTRIIGLIDRIYLHDDLAEHVLAESTRMNRHMSQALGDAEPVYKLSGRCPICDSLSLRVFPDREVVACVNSLCECSDEGCICHGDRPRRHRWIFDQWPGLNEAIDRGAA